MAKIKTVDRTIPILETKAEVHRMVKLNKWIEITEVERYIYEFSKNPDEVKHIDIILNRDYIIEITD